MLESSNAASTSALIRLCIAAEGTTVEGTLYYNVGAPRRCHEAHALVRSLKSGSTPEGDSIKQAEHVVYAFANGLNSIFDTCVAVTTCNNQSQALTARMRRVAGLH